MAQPIIQPSFAAGELSPSLYARVDLAKFHVGSALLRNFFVDYRGGIANRAGSRYVGRVLNQFQAARLIPFQFSTVQAYALLFGDYSMKVIMNGGFVVDHLTGLDFVLSTPYSGVELAAIKFVQSADVMTLCHPNHAPFNLTRSAHDAWTLTPISFVPTLAKPTGVVATPNTVGPTGYSYRVTAIGPNGVTESLPSIFSGTTTALSATLSTTPNAHVTITAVAVPGAVLYNFYRSPEVPNGIAVAGQAYGYIGSSTLPQFVDSNIAPDFSRTPPQFANPFMRSSQSIQSVTVTPGRGYLQPNIVTVTGDGTLGAITIKLKLVEVTGYFSGSGYSNGDQLTLLGGTFTRAAILVCLTNNGATSFAIADPGEYTVLPGTISIGLPNATVNIALAGGTGAGASVRGVWGIGSPTITNAGSGYNFVGATVSTFAANPGGGQVAPSLGTALENPTCTSYYQQRKVYAATVNQPETFWMSKTGDFNNFSYSVPSRADDPITGTIASRQVNAIRHLISTNSLIALSSGGAWRIDSGQQGGAVTPSSIEAAPQAFSGSADVPPILVNYDIMYVQEKGAIVRDLAYNFYVNVYTGADMTTLANHLFYGHTIREWAYAEEPFKIIWAVREDGVLLSFTYLKEQDVYAWAHHDTIGQYKSICTISENGEDAVYVVVQRPVATGLLGLVQFVERFQSRNLGAIPEIGVPGDLARAWFVDCGLSTALYYPNAYAIPYPDDLGQSPIYPAPSISGGTVVNGGSGYTAPTINVEDPTGSGAVVTATVVAGVITAVTVFDSGRNYTNPVFVIVDATGTGAAITPQTWRHLFIEVHNNNPAVLPFAPVVGDILRINHGYGRIARVVSNGVSIDVIQPIYNDYPAFYPEWSSTHPVSTVTGLNHLIGLKVAILADGNVQPQQTVSPLGSVTLESPATAIVVGLPYVSQYRSLYADIPGEVTIQGKRKKIPAVTLRVLDTRGLKIGPDFDHLAEFKERGTEPMGAPIQLITGDERVLVNSDWDEPGQIVAQQDNPLPATVLALIPEIAVGDT